MRKGRDGGEKKMKKKIMAEIVATTSLLVDRLTAIDCNAAPRAKILSNCYNGIISIIHQPYMYEIMPISYLYVTIKVYGRRFT